MPGINRHLSITHRQSQPQKIAETETFNETGAWARMKSRHEADDSDPQTYPKNKSSRANQPPSPMTTCPQTRRKEAEPGAAANCSGASHRLLPPPSPPATFPQPVRRASAAAELGRSATIESLS